MTPAARIQAAIGVLDQVLEGAPAEKALSNWARRSRFAGSKDRAAIRDHVFQALRCRRSYAAFGGGLSGRGLMIGALRADGSAPEDVFTGEGYAPAPLSEAERIAGVPGAADLADMPDWLLQAFQASLGEAGYATAQALRMRAPTMLRVNASKVRPSDAVVQLAKDGVTACEDDIAPNALKVIEGARQISAGMAYQDGWVELQDGSSQAAMAALDVPVGGAALDYCAGGGGKTLALAARAKARWFAYDANPLRMADLPKRAARAGVEVQILTEAVLPDHGPYDLVLCDVPCSGSGTWRRTPEAKWALTAERLSELVHLQAGILRRAMSFVAPRGTLAYATCSVLRDENDAQIDAFLTEHPGWAATARYHWPVSESGDGFFLSTLRCENP